MIPEGSAGRANVQDKKRGGRIRLYPAALACWLDQRDHLATRARDLGAVGEDLRPTLWATSRREDAVGQFQRAHVLDEAIRLVFIRLPADLVIQCAAYALSEHLVDLAAHG